MSRGTEEALFQRKHSDGRHAREKMFSITHHQGNANQNHNEVASHTCLNGYHQKDGKCW